MMPLVISFYTNDHRYPWHAKQLRRDCEKLRLEYRIEEMESSKNWLGNCCIKPFFIRDILREEKRPVLWVDCDNRILRRPDAVRDIAHDCALVRKPPGCARQWMVSVMAFNYTEKALSLLDTWCEATGECSDDSAMEDIWQAGAFGDVSVLELPAHYTELKRRTNMTVIHVGISDGESKKEQLAALRAVRGY